MNGLQTKVSAAGWLCIKRPDGTWLAVFELKRSQLEDFRECAAHVGYDVRFPQLRRNDR